MLGVTITASVRVGHELGAGNAAGAKLASYVVYFTVGRFCCSPYAHCNKYRYWTMYRYVCTYIHTYNYLSLYTLPDTHRHRHTYIHTYILTYIHTNIITELVNQPLL